MCLTISAMRPGPDWLDTAWRLSREADAVGGAIEPGDDLRLRDWAEYFCRYARDMLPFPARETVDFPGDNAVYRRDALSRRATSIATASGSSRSTARFGTRATGSGIPPSSSSTRGVRPGSARSCASGSSTGASTAASAAKASPPARNVAGVLPRLVPFVLLARTYREVVLRRRLRLRLVAATPLLLAYDIAWAAGEAAGHLDSLRGR